MEELQADQPEVAAAYPTWAAAWQNAQYVAIYGSRAYGLDVPESDLDLKGVFIPARDDLLGYRDLPPEQLEFSPSRAVPGRLHGPHDAAIFSLRRLCQLGAACNPNIVEMLFVEPRHVVKITPLGERIRDLGPLFLSQRARQTFGEYARSQLRRLEGHRRWLLDPPTMPRREDFGLLDRRRLPPGLSAAGDRADELLTQANIEEQASALPPHQQAEFIANLAEHMSNVDRAVTDPGLDDDSHAEALDLARQVGMANPRIDWLERERAFKAAERHWHNYQLWQRNRNPARAAQEQQFGMDVKHAMHLVRLMRTCRDLIVDGVLRVYRPDREELVEIRHGLWSYERVLEDVQRHEAEADAAINEGRSPLPVAPDEVAINRLCIDLINRYAQESPP